MAGLPEEPDEEHLQLQQYLADFQYPMWCGSGSWHNWERRFVRWAENEGLTLDYAVNSDLEFHPEVLDGQRLMLSVGHDEYWSWGMRDRVDAFVEGGRIAGRSSPATRASGRCATKTTAARWSATRGWRNRRIPLPVPTITVA